MPVKDEFSRKAAIATSIAMTVLTLLVFFILQDYGPESVVRRFHRAAVAEDQQGIAQTVIGMPNDPNTLALRKLVRDLAASGYRYEFQRLDRMDRRVYAYVVYHPPGPGPGLIIGWVVDKPERRWEINPGLSILPVRPMPKDSNRG